MTRPEMLTYVDSLENPWLKQLYLSLEIRHRDHPDTSEEDFQMIADLLDAFAARATAWYQNRVQ